MQRNESKVVLKNTTIMENPKLYIKSYIENSKLELDNCVFQDCKLIIDNVDFKVNNSTPVSYTHLTLPTN